MRIANSPVALMALSSRANSIKPGDRAIIDRRATSLFSKDLADSYSGAASGGSIDRNGHAQEGCRNGGGVPVLALVLAFEQGLQLLLQIGGPTALFRGFERIHRRPVIFSEGCHEL